MKFGIIIIFLGKWVILLWMKLSLNFVWVAISISEYCLFFFFIKIWLDFVRYLSWSRKRNLSKKKDNKWANLKNWSSIFNYKALGFVFQRLIYKTYSISAACSYIHYGFDQTVLVYWKCSANKDFTEILFNNFCYKCYAVTECITLNTNTR